ncbi:ABC transporter permease [Sediminitomix flava]|uniref:ABC-type lipoprotein release transport system permease subunit n=1 Tax=Sediminitomix flava TaxID=379075 RepID=A0A315YX95_SEDFL|nr:FtsX-like permease family protein [Sediminitomix flava]PWJ34097.1 ABC-type lipoprotein release transport system permease subunit [Sediminitomix flava]
MNKQLNLLEYALLSLGRHWKKQLAIILVYTIVVGFFASVVFFTTSLKEETQVVLEDIPELWVQKLAGGRLQLVNQNWVDSLQDIRGVKSVVPRIWGYNFDTSSGAVFTILGHEKLPNHLQMLETIHDGDLGVEMALCGTGLLEGRGLQIGDYFRLQDSEGHLQRFQIVGTFSANTDLLTKDLIILHPDAARNVLGMEQNQFTDISLEIYNVDEVENIGKKIDQRFGGIRVVTSDQLRATFETLFGWRGGIFIYGSIISILAFLILAWDKASGLSNEEKKELGILKGIGWEISDVLWMKLWESAIISLSATLTGIILAYVHIFIFEAPLLKPFLIGWSVLYPSYNLFPVINLSDVLMILALAVVPYITATIIPAWYGAITEPSEAMRS